MTKGIAEILQDRGLKSTETRTNVLKTIMNNSTATSHTTIQKKLKNTDRITLYRTLNSLIEKRIIHKIDQSNDSYYALCGHECNIEHHHEKHVHFHCTSCKQITCENVKQSIEFDIPNILINKVEIQLEGLCKNCYR